MLRVSKIEPAADRYLRFAEFELDRTARELHRGRVRIPIQEKPLRLLEALLLAEGDVVTRDQLRELLWSDIRFVEYDAGIHTAVRKLREALGESARDPRFIETLSGVGYRFVGEVRFCAHANARARKQATTPPEPPRSFRRYWISAASAASILLIVGVFAGLRDSPAPRARDLPDDSVARRAFLEGLFLKKQQGPESLARAARSFTAAVEQEPDFAPAHAELASVLSRRQLMSGDSCDDCIERARNAVASALTLDDREPAALLADGMIALLFDWDRNRAETSIRLALEGDPFSAEAHLALATWYSSQGRALDAVAAVERAVELDPESLLTRSDSGFFLLVAGRPRDALVECQRVLELDPGFLPAHSCLLRANERLGLVDSALREAQTLMLAWGASPAQLEVLRQENNDEQGSGAAALDAYRRWLVSIMDQQRAGSPVALAALYSALGDRSQALVLLEQAFANRDPRLALMMSYDELEPLWHDQRFIELRRRMWTPPADELDSAEV